MSDSPLLFPVRLGVRAVRVSLLATRELAELGLATLEQLESMVGEAPARSHGWVVPVERVPPGRAGSRVPPERAGSRVPPERAGSFSDRDGQQPAQRPPRRTSAVRPVPAPAPEPVAAQRPPEQPAPGHVDADAELVEEVADPGAEDGAGASLRVAPPFEDYDALRAADVIARLGGADLAELGETELYERTHRARRTVLEAITREIRRRPPR